jgi:hypothetical protein
MIFPEIFPTKLHSTVRIGLDVTSSEGTAPVPAEAGQTENGLPQPALIGSIDDFLNDQRRYYSINFLVTSDRVLAADTSS